MKLNAFLQKLAFKLNFWTFRQNIAHISAFLAELQLNFYKIMRWNGSDISICVTMDERIDLCMIERLIRWYILQRKFYIFQREDFFNG